MGPLGAKRGTKSKSALGRIAGAVTRDLWNVVQDVSKNGIDHFRSAAQVLGGSGWHAGGAADRLRAPLPRPFL